MVVCLFSSNNFLGFAHHDESSQVQHSVSRIAKVKVVIECVGIVLSLLL